MHFPLSTCIPLVCIVSVDAPVVRRSLVILSFLMPRVALLVNGPIITIKAISNETVTYLLLILYSSILLHYSEPSAL